MCRHIRHSFIFVLKTYHRRNKQILQNLVIIISIGLFLTYFELIYTFSFGVIVEPGTVIRRDLGVTFLVIVVGGDGGGMSKCESLLC